MNFSRSEPDRLLRGGGVVKVPFTAGGGGGVPTPASPKDHEYEMKLIFDPHESEYQKLE